jgi:hypothetical protein
MSASLLAEFGRPVPTNRADIGRPSRAASRGRRGRRALRDQRGLLAGLTRLPSPVEVQAGESFLPVSAPGVIGGAIVQAARKSARMNRQKLARMLAVSPGTVRGWEDGT